MPSSDKSHIHVAVIGGGITGVMLALGLLKRGVNYTLYERAPAFTEIGAGIGFSPNAERALKVVDPEVYRIFKQVATTTEVEEYFQWVDGYRTNEIAARLLIGVDAFQFGRRSDFLEAWSKLIAKDNAKFNKELITLSQKDDGKVSLGFKDGTVEEADLVVGCDGINSRVRRLMLGESNPASYPSYTNKYCYRALVPMDKAREVLGAERAVDKHGSLNRLMYIGPNAHCMSYPVAKDQFLNVLLVISDPNPWRSEDGKHTAPETKADAIRAFAEWRPKIRALVDLLPEKLQKWAIFDLFENPVPYYHDGSVAVAGDAAHAAGPHLGSGAGFGVEDALVLASLLEAANTKASGQNQKTKVDLCHDALIAYNNVRYNRTQWLIRATREACALFHWQDEAVGNDFDKFLSEIGKRYHQIWDNDIDGMVEGALNEFDEVLGGRGAKT
ncbi:FAD/NAD(P)-binding domain-containing protein [Hypoxylon cercidicola]|nr:FAD/NAD(P)-binding domain-containing protein [Hypoxylon cercidicola]